MPDKTKATLPGSQSINSKRIGIQITTMIGLVNLDAGNPALGTGIPVSVMHTALSGEAEQPKRLGSVQNRLSLSESVLPVTYSHAQKILKGSLVGVGYKESLSASRASLRWRRLISFLAAAIRKPAVLSSDSFTFSINSKSSSGSLTETCSDLLFLLPVAITESPCVRWCSVCLRKISNQALTWCSPVNILVVFTSFELVSKNDEARQCVNTNRASYHNVIEAYIMAELQSTQTRPEFTYDTKLFTWRFLAVPVSHPEARPIVLYTNAHTEEEARQSLPGWLLFFAARLPLFTPEIKGANHA